MSEQETLAMVPATITERHDDHGCALTVAVDLSTLGVPDRWEYDCVLATDGGEVTLLFYPPDDALDEVLDEQDQQPPSPPSRDW